MYSRLVSREGGAERADLYKNHSEAGLIAKGIEPSPRERAATKEGIFARLVASLPCRSVDDLERE